MALMSLEKWLKLTDGGVTSVRSASLKRVDVALGRYHQNGQMEADKMALRATLQAWMQEKGDWKASVRNRYFAVSDLHKQLMGTPRPPDARELAAVYEMRAQSRLLLETLFRGRKLEWRSEWLGSLGGRRAEAAYDVGQGFGGVAYDSERIHQGDQSVTLKAEKWAQAAFDEIVPLEFRVIVKYALLSFFPDYMRALAASVMPLVGVVTAGADFTLNLGRLARAGYRVSQARKHASQRICVDEPLMAMQAMVVILKRERNFDAVETAVSGTEFGTKVGGLFLDLGTASTAIAGVAAKAARLTNILYVLVKDCYEMKHANEEMESGMNLRRLFEICPLMGAYYICCVPTSVLNNEIFDRFFEGGWRGEVEQNVVKHIEPLREQARRVIADHRFVIKRLQRMPGVMQRNDAALAAMHAAYLKRLQAPPDEPRQIFQGL